MTRSRPHLLTNARFWRASSAVSPTTTRQPGRIWMVVGRTPSGRGGLQPFIEATPSHLLLLQQISSKIARIGCSHRRSARDRRIGLAEPMRTPDSPVYQAEIRHHQIPSSKIPNPLTAADARDGTTRLWQLRGCYVEIAGLSAAFG